MSITFTNLEIFILHNLILHNINKTELKLVELINKLIIRRTEKRAYSFERKNIKAIFHAQLQTRRCSK